MPPDRPVARRPDVRLQGFTERASLEEATAWIAARTARLPAEAAAPVEAGGRVLAEAVVARADLPAADLAAEDGYALRARDTLGAGAYQPLPLALAPAGAALAPSSAALVAAGAPLPDGADAVLPFGAAHVQGDALEVLAPVAEGAGVERRGQEARAGAPLLEAGRVLGPADAALLVTLGLPPVAVIRRPRVRLVVPGPRRGAGGPPLADADGPLLRALVERDGGVIEAVVAGAEGRAALAAALAAPGAELVLVAGRTGTGADDDAPLALGDAGELAIHGVALRPGGSAGLGRSGAVPAVLLPGAPLACLAAYELLAGPAVRRLGGRDPALPHDVREVEVGRKLVSAVGCVEVVWVRLPGGRAEPVGHADDVGLASAVAADGFVVVPAPLEGHAPGARVAVHLHRRTGGGDGGAAR